MPRSSSPPGIEVFTDAEFRQVRTRDDDSDDDFDWGDSGSDHGNAASGGPAGGAPSTGTVTIHVQGDDSESPVPFPADCSKYLASLVDGSDLAGGGAVKKHRMLVSRDGLVLCRAFLDAKRQRQREDRLRMRSGGVVNPDDSGGAGTESAVLKESTACATRLMAAARASHLLRFDDFFDLLAKAFGTRLRTVSLPPMIRERDIERVANELRAALEMPRRASLSDLSKEEMQAIELFFSHHIGDSTQSCVGGGGDRRSDGSTLDVGELAIKESPFLQPSWERDDAVAKCPDCRRDFTAGLSLSWPVVRSHCRVCGKVKCKDCIKHNADPRFARAMKESDVLSQLKCCQRCHDESAHESKRQFLHRFLIASGLNVLEMAALQLVDRDYVVAVHHVFYDIRLSFATGDFVTNPDRARLIMANRELAAGHTQWLVAVFRCTNWADAFEAEAAYQLLRRTVRIIAPQVLMKFDKGGSAAEFGTDAGDRMIPELSTPQQPNAAAAAAAAADDDEDEFADTFPVGDDAARPSSSASYPLGDDAPPKLQCSHFQLMCTRACVDPMIDYCALELLRTVVTVPDGVGGGFAGPCRDLAAELLLASIQSPAMKAAWVPVVLDMLHLQPPQSSVRRLRRVVCELCRRDPSTTMQVTRELTARLRVDNDGPMRGTLETVRSDIEALNEFPAGQLHRVTQLISAINRATDKWNAGTESEAKRALYSALVEFGVASDTQQQQLAAAVGATSTSMSVSASMAKPAGGSFAAASGASSTLLRVPDIVEIHPVPYLFDPAVTIIAIDLARLAVMASKVRPWVVVLVAEAPASASAKATSSGLDSVSPALVEHTSSNSSGRLGKRYSILYKREDVRQDYVVCNAFAAFNEFFAQRGLLKRPVTTYRVVPTGRDRGIVEMVPEAVSVQSECVGSSSPMKSWLDTQMLQPGRRDDKASVDRFRDSFLDSARFYTLGTFLLGVGDRHRGNVLLCGGSGSICHIDFGFVLGAMTATESMTSAKHVRYDADLRKVVESYYRPRRMADQRTVGRGQAFLHDTADMLLALRPYAGFLRLLLHHWVLHDIKRPEEIERFLHARFFVSSNDRDARTQFVDLVEQSFGKNWLQDAAHDVGQIARHGITKNLPFSGWWGGAKGEQ